MCSATIPFVQFRNTPLQIALKMALLRSVTRNAPPSPAKLTLWPNPEIVFRSKIMFWPCDVPEPLWLPTDAMPPAVLCTTQPSMPPGCQSRDASLPKTKAAPEGPRTRNPAPGSQITRVRLVNEQPPVEITARWPVFAMYSPPDLATTAP